MNQARIFRKGAHIAEANVESDFCDRLNMGRLRFVVCEDSPRPDDFLFSGAGGGAFFGDCSLTLEFRQR